MIMRSWAAMVSKYSMVTGASPIRASFYRISNTRIGYARRRVSSLSYATGSDALFRPGKAAFLSRAIALVVQRAPYRELSERINLR